MKVKDIDVCLLQPYENNPRLNEDAVDLVAASIQEFGFKQPIVVDKDLIIIAGHTRWKAAKKLGLETVPCIQADDLTPAQVKAYRLADNKVAEAAQWDMDALQFELEELNNLDFDMEPFGFETEELDDAVAEDDHFEPDIPEEPTTKRGQVWLLGKHRLMVGDSTKKSDVDKLCSDTTADMVVTDPPYNVALGQHMRPSEAKQLHRRTDGLVIDNDSWEDDEGFIEFLKVAFENMTDHLKPGGAFYIWYASTQSKNFLEAAERAGLEIRQTLIWNKNTFALGRQDYQWKHEPCLYGWKEGAAHYFVNSRNLVTVLEGAEDLDIDSLKKDELKEILKSILGGVQGDDDSGREEASQIGSSPNHETHSADCKTDQKQQQNSGHRTRFIRGLRIDTYCMRTARAQVPDDGIRSTLRRRDHSKMGEVHGARSGADI